MSLLTIANNVVKECGFPKFSSVYANTNDEMAQRIVAFANRAGKALHRRHTWQALIREDTFILPASITFATLPDDFGRMIPNSMFDRTNNRKIDVPTTTTEWQRLQANNAGGHKTYARIQEGEFKFYNVTGQRTIYYEYICSNWINSADENGLDAFAADGNTSLISEDLITLECIWRLKKVKGLPDWEDDRNDAEKEIRKVIGQEQTAKTLYLDGSDIEPFPDVMVPDRNYAL